MAKLKLHHFFLIGVAVIIIDQITKLAIHLNMEEHTGFHVLGLDWLQIFYVTNPGMAFGMKLGGSFGKIILTAFRIVAVSAIGYYMTQLYKKHAKVGLQVCVALIFGGAIGNLIDSLFYGLFFPELIADGAPFAFLHGKVVDMFFFDIYQGTLDLPIIGYYNLWLWPVFNVADASIFVSVIVILIFQKKYFGEKEKAEEINGL